MEQPIKISIYTSVYNTKPYVAQCVESVLNQTYTNFEYIILDNGCTDGSSEILAEYAGRDERIKLIRREENQYGFITNILLTEGNGDYVTLLDSDDWLEPRFLERLAALAAGNNLDIACTGSYANVECSGEQRLYQKKKVRPLVIRPAEFQNAFLQYLPYLNVLWGKIIRRDVARQAFLEPCPFSTWAMDTVFCFRMLRLSSGIGIDNSTLHHYRIRAGSVAASYHPTRFDGTIFFFESLMDFFRCFEPVQQKNVQFLQGMYLESLAATLESAALLPLHERLGEYQKMLTHPQTQEILRQRESGLGFPIFLILYGLLDAFLNSGLSAEEAEQAYPQVHAILQAAVPRCCPAVTQENMRILLEDLSPMRARMGIRGMHQFYVDRHRTALLLFGSRSPLRFLPGNSVPLLQILAEDKPDALLRKLKKLAGKKGYAERYALPEAIRMLEQSLKETER